jgi:hypothetical protein
MMYFLGMEVSQSIYGYFYVKRGSLWSY